MTSEIIIVERMNEVASIRGLNELSQSDKNCIMMRELRYDIFSRSNLPDKKVTLEISEIEALKILMKYEFTIVSQAGGPNSDGTWMSWTLSK